MLQYTPQELYTDSPIRKRSPLTPSNPNACPRLSTFMTIKEDLPITLERRLRSCHNPKSQRRPEQLRDQRRQVFLGKVRQASDDKRWESRSDQILRQDYLTRQKQWELDQATSAPPELPTPEEDPDDGSKHQAFEENDMVDQILSQEDEEHEALIHLLNEANNATERPEMDDQEENISEFGSEAEGYDRLFMDVASQQNQQGQIMTSSDKESSLQEVQEMDISPD